MRDDLVTDINTDTYFVLMLMVKIVVERLCMIREGRAGEKRDFPRCAGESEASSLLPVLESSINPLGTA